MVLGPSPTLSLAVGRTVTVPLRFSRFPLSNVAVSFATPSFHTLVSPAVLPAGEQILMVNLTATNTGTDSIKFLSMASQDLDFNAIVPVLPFQAIAFVPQLSLSTSSLTISASQQVTFQLTSNRASTSAINFPMRFISSTSAVVSSQLVPALPTIAAGVLVVNVSVQAGNLGERFSVVFGAAQSGDLNFNGLYVNPAYINITVTAPPSSSSSSTGASSSSGLNAATQRTVGWSSIMLFIAISVNKFLQYVIPASPK
jgi:hypothetical protein